MIKLKINDVLLEKICLVITAIIMIFGSLVVDLARTTDLFSGLGI